MNVHVKVVIIITIQCFVVFLCVQFHHLPQYYQALLITGIVLLTVVEVVRLYLGFIGNLEEKVIQTFK